MTITLETLPIVILIATAVLAFGFAAGWRAREGVERLLDRADADR
jgi:hypothetical protein